MLVFSLKSVCTVRNFSIIITVSRKLDSGSCLRRKFTFQTVLFQSQLRKNYLTLRRQNFIGVLVPVAPDLAKTVKVKSDYSENLAKVFGGAKNGNFG